jgi:hypothetical protein
MKVTALKGSSGDVQHFADRIIASVASASEAESPTDIKRLLAIPTSR